MPHGDWGPMEKTHWVPFRNDAAETIPPFAVIRITGTVAIHGRMVFTGAKPTGTAQTWYAINGPVNVTSGQIGECTFTAQAIVRYSGSTPSYGDVAGPTNGSWDLSSGGTGFTVLGNYTTSRDLTLIEAIQVPAAAAASTKDYAQLVTDGDQTITAGAGQTELSWSTGSDSGGSITSDSANNQIELTNQVAYRFSVMLGIRHDGSGANTTFRSLANCVLAVLNTTSSHQNPTFEAVNLLGHDSSFPVHLFTRVFFYTPTSGNVNVTLTLSAGVGGYDIVVTEGWWTVQEL